MDTVVAILSDHCGLGRSLSALLMELKIYLISNNPTIKIQETRDFDLVTLGPPSKVLQEEQGLEVC